MKKLISLLLIFSALTSCTAYYHSYRAPEGERIKPSDLSELEQGDKIRVIPHSGQARWGILENFEGDSLILKTGRQHSISRTVLLSEAKIVKYDEHVPVTVMKAVFAALVIVGGFIYLALGQSGQLSN